MPGDPRSCFVVGSSEFKFNGRSVVVVRCSPDEVESLLQDVKRQGIEEVWVARSVHHYRKTTTYQEVKQWSSIEEQVNGTK
jgi:hypothetical protein